VRQNSEYSPQPFSPTSKEASKITQRISVKEFIEIEGGFVYAMSNGIVGMEQSGQTAIFNKLTSGYCFITKNTQQKEEVLKVNN
jgi:hypothetical protein